MHRAEYRNLTHYSARLIQTQGLTGTARVMGAPERAFWELQLPTRTRRPLNRGNQIKLKSIFTERSVRLISQANRLRKSLLVTSFAIVCLARLMPAADTGLDYSQDLFTVLAALNAAGYDADIDSPSNNPLRKQLREHLAKQNIPVLPEIR